MFVFSNLPCVATTPFSFSFFFLSIGQVFLKRVSAHISQVGTAGTDLTQASPAQQGAWARVMLNQTVATGIRTLLCLHRIVVDSRAHAPPEGSCFWWTTSTL